MQAPSSVLCHLARRKETCWRSRRSLVKNDASNRVRSLSTSATFKNNKNTTDSGGNDRRFDSFFAQFQQNPFWDLHSFKNGRNISVAEYLNIESKYSSILNVNSRKPKQPERASLGERWNDATSGFIRTPDHDNLFQCFNPTQFSSEALLNPLHEPTTLDPEPIISSPSPHPRSSRSRLTFLDTSRIDLNNLIDMMEGDLFVLELFEKSISERSRMSGLPMLVLSHPKLFNGLVMNPLDVQELTTNPRIWAPILVPESVATILSSLYDKDTCLMALLSDENMKETLSIFPSATISKDSPMDIKCEVASESSSLPAAATSSNPPSCLFKAQQQHRHVGVIRRLSPKEILRLMKSSNPHLQWTADNRKYDFEEVLKEGRREIRYPSVETEVSALYASPGRTGLVKEGSDCVSLFQETTFFSDEYHCQSPDSGVARWGADGELRIFDVESIDGFVLHFGFLHRGTLSVGDRVNLEIHPEGRTATSANHTAAHLLNFGIDQIFPELSGSELKSSRVSHVGRESASINFSTDDSCVTDDDVNRLQKLVNLMVYHKVPVFREDLRISDAKSLNILLSPPIDPLSVSSPHPAFSPSIPARPEFFASESLLSDSETILSESFPELGAIEDHGPSVEAVTVVSVGVPASQLLSNESKNRGSITACSMEACSGTHVPDTSYLNSFVVTRVEDVENGLKRITAVSREGASSAVKNADMISAHVNTLESEASSIQSRDRSVFLQKLAAVEENVDDLLLPATARTEFKNRLDSLSRAFGIEEAKTACVSPIQRHRMDAISSGASLAVTEDITRQLVRNLLETGCVKTTSFYVQHLHLPDPRFVKSGLLFAVHKIMRLTDHRLQPLDAAFFISQAGDRVYCLCHVRGVVDGAKATSKLTASEWMRESFRKADLGLTGGAVNCQLKGEQFYFGATKLDEAMSKSSLTTASDVLKERAWEIAVNHWN